MRIGRSSWVGIVRRPWFDRRPARALAVAGALFLGIFALRSSVGDADDAIAMLYVLPISLVAIGFGRRAGLVAGATAVALLGVWVLIADTSLSAFGWLSRVVPLLLIGVLIGGASDRMRAADLAERRAAAMALLPLDGAEINDSIVQSLAAAKGAIEGGDVDRGLAILDDAIVTGQQLVTRVFGADSSVPVELRRAHPGPRRSGNG
jgi:hypothetical protein